jgi:nitrite reductase/ring-hydroxylating ferredoxin subunit
MADPARAAPALVADPTTVWRKVLDRVETAAGLDRLAVPLGEAINRVTPRRLRDFLSGVWLGHPLHPVLVQVPAGAWLSATILDFTPGAEPAATLLVGVGTVSAVPTALAGWNDWAASLSNEQKRVGLLHAAGNAVAVGLQIASLSARLSGRRNRGRYLSLAAVSVAGAAAYIGGHLTFRQLAGTNQAVPFLRQIPDGWHDVAGYAELTDGKPAVHRVGEVPVLVVRIGDTVTAMVERCAHQTAPLGEGEVTTIGGHLCIVCPLHGSTFRLIDGTVLRGPAATDQPTLRTRVINGRVQISKP